jgi:raffinose/stachyose/melibiose transport system permease protein
MSASITLSRVARAKATPQSGLGKARSRIYWPFLLPALGLYIVLFILPSIASVVVSLTKWNGLGNTMTWDGIGNYVRLAQDSAFQASFLNTLEVIVIGGAAVFLITFASMIVLRTMRGRSFIRSVVFVPYILSPIAIGVAVGFLFNPNGGVNVALRAMGLGNLALAWLSPDIIFKVIIVGFVWSVSGFYVALMMTGVDSIPPELFEAAELEGATRWQQFRDITFPMTRDILSTASVLWVINGVKIFEMVIAFTGTAGTPAIQARTVAVQQYLTVTGGPGGTPELGYASAMGIVMFLLTVALVLLVGRLLRAEVYER